MTNPLTDEVIDKAVELLPCPFCGGEPILLPPTCNRKTPYDRSDRAFPVMRCRCGVTVDGANWDQSGKTAVAAWNTRAAAKVIESALAGDRRDAERYRFIRDVPWVSAGTPLARVISQQRNAHWDQAIDAAIKGKTHE